MASMWSASRARSARAAGRKRLLRFLADGAHGDMDWLAANAERRGDPHKLWPEVRTIVMLGVNYGPDEDPLAILSQRDARRDFGLCARATTITTSSRSG